LYKKIFVKELLSRQQVLLVSRGATPANASGIGTFAVGIADQKRACSLQSFASLRSFQKLFSGIKTGGYDKEGKK
jgi:hypothetical protein